MKRKCGLCAFESESILRIMYREWTLGPVVVEQDQGSSFISIVVEPTVFEGLKGSLYDFKYAVMQDLQVPVKIKFALEADFGAYGFEDIRYDEEVMAWFKSMEFTKYGVAIKFELCAKGKELEIYGISSKVDDEGNRKPLFWASILK